ncbi:MAG TPA: hypothetical protein VMV69_29830 [Pirellulales bacterium]|nr:hypothetical protein [Pirellulales bacterium]
MDELDKQMQQWSTRLRDDLRIGPESNHLATTITKEVAALSDDAKQRVKDASPIPLNIRLEELVAFQGFMDLVRATSAPHPVVVRAQLIYQNYICFVYLGESCFNVLKKELPPGSTAKKCCKFLTDNPVRAFRNAVAHANWRYLPDFSGLEYWARKGGDPAEPIIRFEVSQQDHSFWQALARCTAYASFLTL